jgi:hypothetical protein
MGISVKPARSCRAWVTYAGLSDPGRMPTALMTKKDHDMPLLFGSVIKQEQPFHGQGSPAICSQIKLVDNNLVLL